MLFAVYGVLCVYTQRKLYKLQEQRIRLRMLDSLRMVSFLLTLVFLFALPLAIGVFKNTGCIFGLVLTHVSGGLFISITVHKMLLFTRRQAEILLCKRYMERQLSEDDPSVEANEKTTFSTPFITKVWSGLRGHRIALISLCLFVGSLCFMFTHPGNLKSLQDPSSDACRTRTSTYPIVIWWMGCIPYVFLFLNKYGIIDPFRVVYRFKINLSVATVLVTIQFIILAFFTKTQQRDLFLLDVYCLFMLSYWYTESYSALKRSSRTLDDIDILTSRKHKLVDTLVDPFLLVEFERFLLNTWSPESLYFYKDVVILEVRARKILRGIRHGNQVLGSSTASLIKKAGRSRKKLLNASFEIYLGYIHGDAIQQVNLAAKTANAIHEYFIHFLKAQKGFTNMEISVDSGCGSEFEDANLNNSGQTTPRGHDFKKSSDELMGRSSHTFARYSGVMDKTTSDKDSKRCITNTPSDELNLGSNIRRQKSVHHRKISMKIFIAAVASGATFDDNKRDSPRISRNSGRNESSSSLFGLPFGGESRRRPINKRTSAAIPAGLKISSATKDPHSTHVKPDSSPMQQSPNSKSMEIKVPLKRASSRERFKRNIGSKSSFAHKLDTSSTRLASQRGRRSGSTSTAADSKPLAPQLQAIVADIESLMEVFEPAKQEIYLLMEHDSHNRFITLPHIAKYLAGLTLDHASDVGSTQA
ncbi:hypothetical protein AAMO2058_001097100 [Amorphochlora amoebiformis]